MAKSKANLSIVNEPGAPYDYISMDTEPVKEWRTFEEQLVSELSIAKKHNATLLQENARLRKMLNQPEHGPIWPAWIMKDTVRKRDHDEQYIYEGLNEHGDQMVMRIDGKWERVARVVYAKYYGPISKDQEVHHIDGDKFNNDPDNLEVINKSDFYREENNYDD